MRSTPLTDAIFRNTDPRNSTASPVRAADPLFHTLDVTKLVILSVCTLGLYELYWFYRNWKRMREFAARDVSPFWRAFFSPLWAYSLFREVHDDATAQGNRVSWSGGWLGILYLFLSLMWRLPNPWWLVTLGTVIPVAVVQSTINDVAQHHGVVPDRTYSGKHGAVIAIGGIVFLLAILGTLFPE